MREARRASRAVFEGIEAQAVEVQITPAEVELEGRREAREMRIAVQL